MQLNDSMEYLVNLNNAMLVNNAMGSAASLIGKMLRYQLEMKLVNMKILLDKLKVHLIKDGVVCLELELSDTGEIKEVEYSSLVKVTK